MDWTDGDSDNVVGAAEDAMPDFIDPADGSKKSQGFFQAGLNLLLMTDYGVGGLIDSTQLVGTRIEWAVSESPIPQPTALAVLAIDLVGLRFTVFSHRRRPA